jgi:hypothetical protein
VLVEKNTHFQVRFPPCCLWSGAMLTFIDPGSTSLRSPGSPLFQN